MVSIDIHTFLDNRIGREFIAPACTCGERAKVAGMKQLKIGRSLSSLGFDLEFNGTRAWI